MVQFRIGPQEKLGRSTPQGHVVATKVAVCEHTYESLNEE